MAFSTPGADTVPTPRRNRVAPVFSREVTRPGTSVCKVMLSHTCALEASRLLRTSTEMGTYCRFSVRRSAVTTTSCSAAPCSAGLVVDPCPSPVCCALHNWAANAQPNDIARVHIKRVLLTENPPLLYV